MLGVERNFDGYIGKPAQPVNRLEVGYAHVDGANNPDRPAQLLQPLKYLLEKAYPLKFQEGHQPPDFIGSQHLFFELTLHRHPQLAAGKKLRLAQPRIRKDILQMILQTGMRKRRPPEDRPQQLPLRCHLLARQQLRRCILGQQPDQLVGELQQPRTCMLILGRRQLLKCLLQPLSEKATQKNSALVFTKYLFADQQIRPVCQGSRKAARYHLLIESFLHGSSVGWVAVVLSQQPVTASGNSRAAQPP